jgi:hypothetical protein
MTPARQPMADASLDAREAAAPDAGTASVRRAVLVVGSAKPRGTSTSESFGRALLGHLEARGAETAVVYAHQVDGDLADVRLALHDCDLLVLASPLYFDALPSQVVSLLARIADWRGSLVSPRPMGFAAILNCGTPDAHQADAAIAMCGLAARAARLAWRGGMAVGEGDAIRGREPASLGAGRVTDALALAAEALATGGAVPLDAQRLAAVPLMPEGRYALLSNAGWLIDASRHKALLSIGDRPMEE